MRTVALLTTEPSQAPVLGLFPMTSSEFKTNWHQDQKDGSAGKVTCHQIWQPKFAVPRTHMVKGESQLQQIVLTPCNKSCCVPWQHTQINVGEKIFVLKNNICPRPVSCWVGRGQLHNSNRLEFHLQNWWRRTEPALQTCPLCSRLYKHNNGKGFY